MDDSNLGGIYINGDIGMNGIFNIIVITIIGNITVFGYTYLYGVSPQAIPGIASILLIDVVVSAVILNDLKEV